MQIDYILFDTTSQHKALRPFTYTKSISALRVGITTISQKAAFWFGQEVSNITLAYLQEKHPYNPIYKDTYVYHNSSYLLCDELSEEIESLPVDSVLYENKTIITVKTKQEIRDYKNFDSIENLQKVLKNTELKLIELKENLKEEIITIKNTWDIFKKNAQAINQEIKQVALNKEIPQIKENNPDQGIFIYGENPVYIHPTAQITHCTLNATEGPIFIGEQSQIMEGSHIRGPFVLAEHSIVKMGAKIYGATTIGPHSKIGGEINNVVIQGYSNKGHDGFLGNSVIGEWCNLGADTNNSNLKNNYAPVRLWNYEPESFSKTGLQFCGLMMGDHSKCGINTMFNTGTVIGVSANIFGSGFPRNFVPSFSWGGSSGFSIFQINKAFEVAQNMMKRRSISFCQKEQNILKHIFEITKPYRKGYNH